MFEFGTTTGLGDTPKYVMTSGGYLTHKSLN